MTTAIRPSIQALRKARGSRITGTNFVLENMVVAKAKKEATGRSGLLKMVMPALSGDNGISLTTALDGDDYDAFSTAWHRVSKAILNAAAEKMGKKNQDLQDHVDKDEETQERVKANLQSLASADDVIEAARTKLENTLKETSAALQRFPKRENGLTPDEVKASVAWKTAKQANDKAFAALRSFNGKHKPKRKPR